ncbi:hypothetical protein [Brooklawnia sp.]
MTTTLEILNVNSARKKTSIPKAIRKDVAEHNAIICFDMLFPVRRSSGG